MIHLELYKRLEMHKPEFVLENKTHKILWDFEIQGPDRLLINKKKDLSSNRFCHSSVP